MRGQSVQLDLQLTCMFQLFSTVARGRWGSWALQVMTSPSSSSLAVIHRELTVTLPSGLVYKVDIRCEEGQSVRFVESRYWNHLRSLQIRSDPFRSSEVELPEAWRLQWWSWCRLSTRTWREVAWNPQPRSGPREAVRLRGTGTLPAGAGRRDRLKISTSVRSVLKPTATKLIQDFFYFSVNYANLKKT